MASSFVVILERHLGIGRSQHLLHQLQIMSHCRDVRSYRRPEPPWRNGLTESGLLGNPLPPSTKLSVADRVLSADDEILRFSPLR